MTTCEQIARRMCAIDLEAKGFSADAIPQLVERFWPVTANEIRQGIVEGDERAFTAADIKALEDEYRSLSPTPPGCPPPLPQR